MTELSSDERALIDLARSAEDPSPQLRAQMRASLMAELGLAAGVGAAAAAGAAEAAVAGAGAGVAGADAGAAAGAVAAHVNAGAAGLGSGTAGVIGGTASLCANPASAGAASAGAGAAGAVSAGAGAAGTASAGAGAGLAKLGQAAAPAVVAASSTSLVGRALFMIKGLTVKGWLGVGLLVALAGGGAAYNLTQTPAHLDAHAGAHATALRQHVQRPPAHEPHAPRQHAQQPGLASAAGRPSAGSPDGHTAESPAAPFPGNRSSVAIGPAAPVNEAAAPGQRGREAQASTQQRNGPAIAKSPSRAATPSSSASSGRSAVAGIGGELGLLQAAQRNMREGDPAKALKILDAHEQQYGAGRLGEERMAARVFALCKLGRVAEARAAAQRFLAIAPQSPLAPRVARGCESP